MSEKNNSSNTATQQTNVNNNKSDLLQALTMSTGSLFTATKITSQLSKGMAQSFGTAAGDNATIQAIRITTDDSIEAINQSTQQILNGLNIINRGIIKTKTEVINILRKDNKSIGTTLGTTIRRITDIEAANKLYDRKIIDLDQRMKKVELKLSSLQDGTEKDDLDEMGFPPSSFEDGKSVSIEKQHSVSTNKMKKRVYSPTRAIEALQARHTSGWGKIKTGTESAGGIAGAFAAASLGATGLGAAVSKMAGGNAFYNPEDYSSPDARSGDVRNTPIGFGGDNNTNPGRVDPSEYRNQSEVPINQKGYADPSAFYKKAVEEVANSKLNGYIPKDGAKFGIDGTPESWAKFITANVKQESNFNTNDKNLNDPGGSYGLGQFGIGQYGINSIQDSKDPTKTIRAYINVGERFVVGGSGLINGKGNSNGDKGYGAVFGSIRRENEHLQHMSWADKLASGVNPSDLRQSGDGEKFGFTTNKPYTKEEVDNYLKQVKDPKQLTLGLNPDYGGFDESYKNIKEKGIGFHLYDQGVGDEKFKYNDGSNESKLIFDKDGKRIDPTERLFKRIEMYNPKSFEVDNTGTGASSIEEHLKVLNQAKDRGVTAKLVAKNLTPDERETLKARAKEMGVDHLLAPNSIYETGDKDAKAAYESSKANKSGYILSNDTNRYQTNTLQNVPSPNESTIGFNSIRNQIPISLDDPNQVISAAKNGEINPFDPAIEKALKLKGMHEVRDRQIIKQYLRDGGVSVDPASTAWCAAFVNSTLEQTGVKGSGSLVANSFQKWGIRVSGDDVAKGDVLLKPNGGGYNQVGGHVGIATGKRDESGRIEMLQGNSKDSVRTTWESPNSLMIRRGQYDLKKPESSTTYSPGSYYKENPNAGGSIGENKAYENPNAIPLSNKTTVSSSGEAPIDVMGNVSGVSTPDAVTLESDNKTGLTGDAARSMFSKEELASADAVAVPSVTETGFKGEQALPEEKSGVTIPTEAKTPVIASQGDSEVLKNDIVRTVKSDNSKNKMETVYTGNKHDEGSNMSSSGHGAGQRSKDGPAFCNI